MPHTERDKRMAVLFILLLAGNEVQGIHATVQMRVALMAGMFASSPRTASAERPNFKDHSSSLEVTDGVVSRGSSTYGANVEGDWYRSEDHMHRSGLLNSNETSALTQIGRLGTRHLGPPTQCDHVKYAGDRDKRWKIINWYNGDKLCKCKKSDGKSWKRENGHKVGVYCVEEGKDPRLITTWYKFDKNKILCTETEEAQCMETKEAYYGLFCRFIKWFVGGLKEIKSVFMRYLDGGAIVGAARGVFKTVTALSESAKDAAGGAGWVAGEAFAGGFALGVGLVGTFANFMKFMNSLFCDGGKCLGFVALLAVLFGVFGAVLFFCPPVAVAIAGALSLGAPAIVGIANVILATLLRYFGPKVCEWVNSDSKSVKDLVTESMEGADPQQFNDAWGMALEGTKDVPAHKKESGDDYEPKDMLVQLGTERLEERERVVFKGADKELIREHIKMALKKGGPNGEYADLNLEEDSDGNNRGDSVGNLMKKTIEDPARPLIQEEDKCVVHRKTEDPTKQIPKTGLSYPLYNAAGALATEADVMQKCLTCVHTDKENAPTCGGTGRCEGIDQEIGNFDTTISDVKAVKEILGLEEAGGAFQECQPGVVLFTKPKKPDTSPYVPQVFGDQGIGTE